MVTNINICNIKTSEVYGIMEYQFVITLISLQFLKQI